jgi:hypothetical protein
MAFPCAAFHVGSESIEEIDGPRGGGEQSKNEESAGHLTLLWLRMAFPMLPFLPPPQPVEKGQRERQESRNPPKDEDESRHQSSQSIHNAVPSKSSHNPMPMTATAFENRSLSACPRVNATSARFPASANLSANRARVFCGNFSIVVHAVIVAGSAYFAALFLVCQIGTATPAPSRWWGLALKE